MNNDPTEPNELMETPSQISSDIKGEEVTNSRYSNLTTTGLKWGAYIGIGIKLVDIAIAVILISPTEMVLQFLLYVGLFVFMTYRGGLSIGIAISLLTGYMYRCADLVAGGVLAGAILGCLPGMAIANLFGIFRRSKARCINRNTGEVFRRGMATIVLPALSGVIMWILYFSVLSPWSQKRMQEHIVPFLEGTESQTNVQKQEQVQRDCPSGSDAETSRCVMLIKSALTDAWEQPGQADAGPRPTLLAIKIDASGQITSSSIRQSSGSDFFDDTVLRAAAKVKSIKGLSLEFIKDHEEIVVEFKLN